MSTIRVVEDLRRKKKRRRGKKIDEKSLVPLATYLDQPDVVSAILSTTVAPRSKGNSVSVPVLVNESIPSRRIESRDDVPHMKQYKGHFDGSMPRPTSLSSLLSENKVPVFSTISKETKKKIERLPEPNEYEQKVLDRLQEEYIDGEVDLSLKSPSLYKGLKKGATLARRRSLFKKKRVFLSKSVEQKACTLMPKKANNTLPNPTISTPGNKKRADKNSPISKTLHGEIEIKSKVDKATVKATNIKEKSGTSEKVTSAAGTDNSFPGHEGIGIKNNSTTNQSDDKSNSEWNAAYPPSTASSARIFEKLDSKQEAPEYGEDYRKDNFAYAPPEPSTHDEAVADKINMQLQDLNRQILESSKRKKESIAKIAKDVRNKFIIVENSQNRLMTKSATQYHYAKEKVKRIDETIKDKMEEARNLLPADFMFKRGLGAFVMARGAEVIFKVFRRFTDQILHSAIEHWQEFIVHQKHIDRENAAVVIQKVARGFFARNDLRQREAEKVIQDEREQERLARLYKKRYDAAKLIQAHVRGNIGRKIVFNMKLRTKSVLVIQRFIRMTQAKFFLLTKRIMWMKRKAAATKIQSFFRGCKGRYRAKIVRKIRRAEKFVEHEHERHAQLQIIFQKEGAAVRIQEWWETVRRRHEFLRMRKLIKRRRVMVIQRSFRCYRARCELSKRRQEKRLEDENMMKAAKLIQAAYYRKKAYKKVRGILNQEEADKLKHHEYLQHQKDDKKMHIVGGLDINLTKMRRRMYNARKLLNPFEGKREAKAALKIQASFRGMKTRKRLKDVRKQHHLEYRRKMKLKRLKSAKMIQRFWRGLIGRRLFLQARKIRMAIRVQARFRGWKGRQIALEVGIRFYAAIKIQALFRGFLQRLHFAEYCRIQNLVKVSAVKIQTQIRGFLNRQLYGEKLERERYLSEIRMRGRTELEACATLARDKLLLKYAKAKAKSDGATQMLFQVLKDLSKTKDGVAPKSFLKFAKDSKMIDDKRIKLNTCDLAVSKAKGISKAKGTGNGAGNLTYMELMYALQYLANKKYPKLETLRRHKDEDARFIKFCYEFIFTDGRGSAKEKKQALKRLPSYARPVVKKMDEVQNTYLGKYARRIQGHMRGEFGRNLYEIQKRRILKERERAKMVRASLMISKRQRILKARKVVASMAAKIIQKFVDPHTGDMYYYNPRTGQRSYEKPEVLGRHDVEKPFILPDKHYEFVVKCAHCKTNVAKYFCDPCGDAYCGDCFHTLHSKGNKAKHHRDEIPICSFCDYQACTRFDKFHKQWCDSCYEHVYEDTAQAKTFTWNVLPCAECGERACKWRCVECEDVYCTKCFAKIHRTGNRSLHTNVPLAYYTVKMENQRLAVEREAQRKLAAEKAAKQMLIDNNMKMEFVARKLQAIWRGRQGRAKGKQYLKQERKKMRVMYKKRKEDDKTRKSVSYGLKSLVGLEEILETDDAETRARKERSLLRDPNKALEHFQDHAFEFKIKGAEGKLLPFKVNCYRLEVEFETLGDLREYLKPGDNIRIGYADHTINMDTEERNYTHQFMSLDRPWANDDLLNADIYKMPPPPRKIGLSAELTKLALGATKGTRGVISEVRASAISKFAKNLGSVNKVFKSKMIEKAQSYYDATSQRELSKSLQEERTPAPFEKERRYWTENLDEWGTPSWYNRITDETVYEKPECLLNKEEMKEFKAKEAIKKAKEEEIAAQKRELEWKKKQREKAKSGRGGRGRGRRR